MEIPNGFGSLYIFIGSINIYIYIYIYIYLTFKEVPLLPFGHICRKRNILILGILLVLEFVVKVFRWDN